MRRVYPEIKIGIFLIVIVLIVSAMMVKSENKIRDACREVCKERNMSLVGYEDGNCVCTKGLMEVSRVYVPARDRGNHSG